MFAPDTLKVWTCLTNQRTQQTLTVLQRRSAVVGTAGAAAVLWNYRKDYTELQFDAATASADLLNLLDAESAHNWGIWAAKQGIVPRESRVFPQSLRTRVWNRDFANPIGAS